MYVRRRQCKKASPVPGCPPLTFCLLPPPSGNDIGGGCGRRLTAEPEVNCQPRSWKVSPSGTRCGGLRPWHFSAQVELLVIRLKGCTPMPPPPPPSHLPVRSCAAAAAAWNIEFAMGRVLLGENKTASSQGERQREMNFWDAAESR